MEEPEGTLTIIFLEGKPKCAVSCLSMQLEKWKSISETRRADVRWRKGMRTQMLSHRFLFHGSKSAKLLSHCFRMIVLKSPSYVDFRSIPLLAEA